MYFYPPYVKHPSAALTRRSTATLNETASGLSAAQTRSPKTRQVGNATASGGLKWQYIAMIPTLFIFLLNYEQATVSPERFLKMFFYYIVYCEVWTLFIIDFMSGINKSEMRCVSLCACDINKW